MARKRKSSTKTRTVYKTRIVIHRVKDSDGGLPEIPFYVYANSGVSSAQIQYPNGYQNVVNYIYIKTGDVYRNSSTGLNNGDGSNMPKEEVEALINGKEVYMALEGVDDVFIHEGDDNCGYLLKIGKAVIAHD